mmetsp:Transcript_1119/g.2428  ORF Transcript_1119/g.2428 Transcript_1119/m.2428 type:complete len:603 (+) Transcript_1119:1115-2923(+)
MTIGDPLDDVHDGRRIQGRERNRHRRLVGIDPVDIRQPRRIGRVRRRMIRIRRQQEIAILSDAPNPHVQQPPLRSVIVPYRLEQLVRRIGPQILRGARNVHGRGTLHVGGALPAGDGQEGDEGVDPPEVRGAEFVDDLEDAGANVGAVLAGTEDEVVEELGGEGLDVFAVDEVVDEFEGALADADVGVFEAVYDGGAVSLEGGGGGVVGVVGGGGVRAAVLFVMFVAFGLSVGDALGQGVERHVANVVVAVEQEAPQNVDRQDPQAVVALHGHDGLHALVEDGVARVLGRLRVGGHLRQDVVHLLGRLGVVGAQQPQQGEQLHLQEGVGDAPHVVVGRVAHAEQVPQQFDQRGDQFQKGRATGALVVPVAVVVPALVQVALPIHDQDAGHELHHRDEHPVAAVVQQTHHAVHEVLHHVGALGQTPRHGQTRLLPQVGLGAPQVLVHLRRQVARHVRRGQVADGAQRQPGDELVLRVQVVLQRVGGQHEHVGLLRQQQQHAQVADALLGEVRRRHELHALQLPEVGGVAQHVHEEQLGHVAVPVLLLFFADGGADHGGFFGDHGAFFGGGFAGADLPDEVSQFQRHFGGLDVNVVCVGLRLAC